MRQKRGLILIISVLVLALFVVGQDPVPAPDSNRIEWAEAPLHEGVESCVYLGRQADNCPEHLTLVCERGTDDCDDEVDDSMSRLRTEAPSYARGCVLAFVDSAQDDNCATGYLPPGAVINSEFQKFAYEDYYVGTGWKSNSFRRWWWFSQRDGVGTDVSGGCIDRYGGWICEEDAIACLEADVRTEQARSYICAHKPGGQYSDYMWLLCDQTHKNAAIWGEDIFNYLFECRCDDSNICDWKKIDSDEDKDGFTRIQDGDSQDNPEEDPEGCPTVNEEEYLGLTQQQIRVQVKDLCQYPTHSLCAVCRNPGAPETCGDGVDNDDNPQTSDDCNLFQEGCEQKSFTATNNPVREELAEMASWLDLRPHSNVKGESFSWIGDRTSGACCGFNGINDAGETFSSDQFGGEHICLNKDLVGVHGEDATGIGTSWEFCEGRDWCWVSATGDAKFNIYTIKKPLEEPFDAVSNGKQWYTCGAENLGPLSTSPEAAGFLTSTDIRQANKFYCYREDSRWSWAECVDPNEPVSQIINGIKTRYIGDGLFALIPDEGITTGTITVSKEGYESFYGNARFDITGNGEQPLYLEFMVRFISDITIPAGVKVTIFGPNDILYFEKEVLADAVNNPLLEKRKWIQVRTEIPSLVGVEGIKIESTQESDQIEAKNIFITSEETPILCSGETSQHSGKSAWLQDLDFWEGVSPISGEKICNERYALRSEDDTITHPAWLGGEEVTDAQRRCCGNNPHEYYAGPSESNYGCWNSEPIASGETTMNVEVEVEYTTSSINILYEEMPFSGVIFGRYLFDSVISVVPDESEIEEEFVASHEELQSNIMDYVVNHVYNARNSVVENNYVTFGEPTVIDVQDMPLKREESEYRRDISLDYTITINYLMKLKEIYFTPSVGTDTSITATFLNEVTGENLGDVVNEQNINYGLENIILVVEGGTVTVEEGEPTRETSTQVYSCPSSPGNPASDCLFPLPGEPPYTITNPHPDLYELYFVSEENQDGEPITPTNNGFDTAGILKAKKIAQQIIFVNEGEDATEDPSFFGCQAASFVEENLPVDFTDYETLDYCSSKANTFCSYSKTIEPDQRERYTTINTWSDEQLPAVGYDSQGIDEISGSAEDFLRTTEFLLRTDGPDLPITPDRRNYSTSIVPGRNMISNAGFQTSGARELPHWEIFASDGTPWEDEENFVHTEEGGNKVSLLAGMKLRSEKIAVPKNSILHFSQNLTCTAEIIIIDKDGAPTGDSSDLAAIQTREASYAIVEFTGACSVKMPVLQLLDDLGAAVDRPLPTDELSRSGAACCPDNYCWNGYVCVAPMGPFTYLAEHIEDGRDYRCINGEWNYQPVKFDWNRQQWGFCEQQQQCLVLGSTAGASPENTAGSFYVASFPTCIGDTEYILDHYCNQGSWTSRTQFLADKLLEVAGDEDFILYCTNYQDALLSTENFGDKDTYLGGPNTIALQPLQDLGAAIAGGTAAETIQTCYTELGDNPTAAALIEAEENTCINNVCILIPKNGKTAFATTLNKNITDPQSFLLAFNVPQYRLPDLCQGTGEFIRCDLSEFGVEGDFWFVPELNAVVYSKEGISLTPGFIDRVIEFFRDFFGIESELSDEEAFVDQAQNFRELYLLNAGAKKIRALQEIFSDEQRTLIAEYEGFTTPVCSYVQNLAVPADLQAELLEQVTDRTKLSCTSNNSIQRIELIAGLDFFWPQLTGSLRVS